jgi:hypothetical protein
MTRMTLFFFHLVWRRSVFFSFYKLTSYPFTISSPVPNGRLFYLFIPCHPSTPIHLCLFIFFVFVFVFFYFMSLSAFVVSDVYRSLCTCESVNYMSCPCLLFFSSLFRLFFSFYGCC